MHKRISTELLFLIPPARFACSSRQKLKHFLWFRSLNQNASKELKINKFIEKPVKIIQKEQKTSQKDLKVDQNDVKCGNFKHPDCRLFLLF